MINAQIKVAGTVKLWQTDLITGEKVLGSEKEFHNTIGADLKAYLAQCMAEDVSGESIKTADLQVANAYAAGKSGIAFIASGGTYQSIWFVTTLNDGGDGTEVYTEFYGYVDGAATLNGSLQLGSVQAGGASASDYTNIFATYAINETVPAARRFHFYWKVTMS
jgi:hypothetical protein